VHLKLPPNKRLKLAGADRSKGSGRLRRCGRELYVQVHGALWAVSPAA
jgi:hypothetical protein